LRTEGSVLGYHFILRGKGLLCFPVVETGLNRVGADPGTGLEQVAAPGLPQSRHDKRDTAAIA